MIGLNILVGIILMLITILIHSFVTRYAIHIAKKAEKTKRTRLSQISEFWIALLVLMMFFASFLESSIWAFVYLWIGAIPDFETSLYFSIVTFTTLGYGDVTLPNQWNLLASIEAAIGIIIFGWTTAIVMAVVQRLYFKKT